jgi:hypothetical protein
LTGQDSALIDFPLDADDSDLSRDTKRPPSYLDLATNTGQETAIDDFVRELLRTAGLEEDRFLRTRHIIPLTICDDSNRVAQTDMCLLDERSTTLPILREDEFQ